MNERGQRAAPFLEIHVNALRRERLAVLEERVAEERMHRGHTANDFPHCAGGVNISLNSHF